MEALDWKEQIKEVMNGLIRFCGTANIEPRIEDIISIVEAQQPVKPACENCKHVYKDKDIEQILYCGNPKFAEYVSVVFGSCDGSISVNENFGCIDFESKSV